MQNFFASINKLLSETMAYFYAVAKGRNPGIYTTWKECQAEVTQFSRPIFKKFASRSEAENFISSHGSSSVLKVKSPHEISASNGLRQNFEKFIPNGTSKVDSPFDELERRLKDWAKNRKSVFQLDVQLQAVEIAAELGIENFNQHGGWLKYHIECNPNIYKSLRAQSSDDEQLGHITPKQNTIIEQKLDNLDKKISGLTTSGIPITGRVRILERTLHSMHQELHDIKRLLSTDASIGSSTASNGSRKRKKIADTEDEEICESSSYTEKSSDKLNNFQIDENGFVNVFTDGACSGNGRKGAAAGIGVWFGDNHPLNVSRPVADGCRATNNLAEIQAVTVAANQATKAGVKKLKINTDSQFLISCITQWMPKWKRNGWKKSDGDNVINKTELIEMESALKPLTIAWNHVRGHAGVHGNEMADQLARAGAAARNKK